MKEATKKQSQQLATALARVAELEKAWAKDEWCRRALGAEKNLAAANARVKELTQSGLCRSFKKQIAEAERASGEKAAECERYREALVHIGEEHDEDSGNGPALRRRGLARLALAASQAPRKEGT